MLTGPEVFADWPGPDPGAAPLARRVAAQATLELRTTLRNGEQLLLALIIPVLLLVGFAEAPLISVGHGPRIDFIAPGILALVALSSAFTSVAITTGFERRYGVLKRLGATPLSRSGLIMAKALATLAIEAGQVIVLAAISLALGWKPHGGAAGVAAAAVLLIAGTAAFAGLALLLAGNLRAEATLAAANLLFLVMLGLGGIVFPLAKFPAAIQPVLRLLPAGALSDGLRVVCQHGSGWPARDMVVLAVWALAALAAAAATFRWE